MKIQDLAIIFIIIILPISIVLSAYTQFQISTLNLQTQYDTKLTSATYDAIKAFQINTSNSTLSDLSNSKLRDIEASVATFKNSLKSIYGLNGYSDETLNDYIPALVYTMYDGLYIYSPYTNRNYLGINDDGENMYGLKPYITYSVIYKKGATNLVITYSLDNYITINGTINGTDYINRDGYLIEGISALNYNAAGEITSLKYNGITITEETTLKEYVDNRLYPYIKENGTKYYYDDNGTPNINDDEIFYMSNNVRTTHLKNGAVGAEYNRLKNAILHNKSALKYYEQAYQFTEYVKNDIIEKVNLRYSDAYEYQENQEKQIWPNNNNKIFQFDGSVHIENKTSTFNEHRLEVIRHKIESNLAIAVANYNNYSKSNASFQMPELKEEEWALVMDNISLISFIQGLSIGGKVYNGYSIVNNTENNEVVHEESIYILGNDDEYHRVNDMKLVIDNTISYEGNNGGNKIAVNSTGRSNLDFNRQAITDDIGTRYYYPLRNHYASYTSVVMQNDMERYEDIYTYVNGKNDEIKTAFYTALGRERYGMYKALRTNT